MTDFSTLLSRVADSKGYALEDVLLGAQLLSSRLKSEEFKNWVNFELGGYPDDVSVPDYRRVKCPILGDFSGNYMRPMREQPLSTHAIPQNIREYFDKATFKQNVGELAVLAVGVEPQLIRVFSGTEISLIREHVEEFEGYTLIYAKGIVHRSSISGILLAVRSRLLRFMTTLLDAYPDLEESGTAIKSVAPSTVSTIFNNCVFAGDQSMGDSYRVNQAGAVGPGSQTHGSTFQQVWLQCKDGVDLRELSKELSTLHAELKSRATDPEHEIAVGSVAAAEKAAAAGDGPKAIEYLKKAGAWALDIAAKIGVGVAIPTIVKALAGTSG